MVVIKQINQIDKSHINLIFNLQINLLWKT